MSKENAHDPGKLTMEEYRKAYGKPSPLEKAIARQEGKDLSSSEKPSEPTAEETIKRQLSELTSKEKDEILKELFGD